MSVSEPLGDVVRIPLPVRRPRRRRPDRPVVVRVPEGGTPVSERWLVRRAALGDASAWEALCEAYLPPVWQWALELGNAEPEAGQVCEMVWLRFAQVLSDFGDDSVRGWLRHAVVEESWRVRRLAAARDSLASATDGVDPGAASAFGA